MATAYSRPCSLNGLVGPNVAMVKQWRFRVNRRSFLHGITGMAYVLSRPRAIAICMEKKSKNRSKKNTLKNCGCACGSLH